MSNRYNPFSVRRKNCHERITNMPILEIVRGTKNVIWVDDVIYSLTK